MAEAGRKYNNANQRKTKSRVQTQNTTVRQPRKNRIDVPLGYETSTKNKNRIDIPLGDEMQARRRSQQSTQARSRIDIPIENERIQNKNYSNTRQAETAQQRRTRKEEQYTTTTENRQRAKRKAKTQQTAQRQKPEKNVQQQNQQQSAHSIRSKARHRRRNRALVRAGIVITAIIIGFALSVTVLFPIKDYRIDGNIIYSQEEVMQVFGHAEGENIFRFNAEEAEAVLLRALPYIETVRIRRRLPGTVVFIAEPAVETYYAQINGQVLVLSAGFKILRITDVPPEGLCMVLGVNAMSLSTPGNSFVLENEEQRELLKTVAALVQKWFPTGVTYIDISNPMEITIIYENRYLIRLGTVNKLDYKLEMAATTIFNELGPEETGVLDASYAGKVFYAAGPAPSMQNLPGVLPPAEEEAPQE